MAGIQSTSLSAAQTLASVSPQNSQSLQPFANLDLTATQRSQLRSIFQSAKQNGTSPSQVQQQVNSVLTPAQQQALQSDQAAFNANGGHHHHHHRSSSDASSADTSDALAAPTSPASSSTAASTRSSATSADSASTSNATANANTTASSSTKANQTLAALLANLQNQAAAATSTNNNTLQAQLIAGGSELVN